MFLNILTLPTIFVFALLINFSTLYVVAYRSRRSTKALLTNPAFILGDFLLIPAYFAVVSQILISNLSLLISMNAPFVFVIVVLSGLVTLWFGFKFRLIKLVWVPHGIIHWLIVFSFVLSVIASVSESSLWPAVLLCAGLLISHQFLGVIFPKVL